MATSLKDVQARAAETVARFCRETGLLGEDGTGAKRLHALLVEALTAQAEATAEQVEAECCKAIMAGVAPGSRVPALYAVDLIRHRDNR